MSASTGPPTTDPRPTTSHWRQATTRWADDDVYGHMNNARYFELIDTAVNAHLAEATGVDIRALPAIGVVAEVSCRYFREVGYPEPVDLGLVVDRVGTSSVVYRVGLFQGDAATRPPPRAGSCTCTSTTPTRRGRSTPMPDEIRAAVEPLLRADAAGRRSVSRHVGPPGQTRTPWTCATVDRDVAAHARGIAARDAR